MSDSEDIIDLPEEGGDDLFGDEGDEVMSDQGNVLSDRDLESDREDDRDRIEDEDDYPREDRDSQHLAESIPLYRHRIPKSKDNTVRMGLCINGSNASLIVPTNSFTTSKYQTSSSSTQ